MGRSREGGRLFVVLIDGKSGRFTRNVLRLDKRAALGPEELEVPEVPEVPEAPVQPRRSAKGGKHVKVHFKT